MTIQLRAQKKKKIPRKRSKINLDQEKIVIKVKPMITPVQIPKMGFQVPPPKNQIAAITYAIAVSMEERVLLANLITLSFVSNLSKKVTKGGDVTKGLTATLYTLNCVIATNQVSVDVVTAVSTTLKAQKYQEMTFQVPSPLLGPTE